MDSGIFMSSWAEIQMKLNFKTNYRRKGVGTYAFKGETEYFYLHIYKYLNHLMLI